jgi:hypothetical protein
MDFDPRLIKASISSEIIIVPVHVLSTLIHLNAHLFSCNSIVSTMLCNNNISFRSTDYYICLYIISQLASTIWFLTCFCFLMVLLQITGLTNNSYFHGAHDIRHCVRKHPDLGRFVLEVAKVYTKEIHLEKHFSVCIPVTKA